MVQELSKTDSIFWSAVEITDAAQRNHYLDDACAGDPDLRRQLDELLAAYPKVDQFLERPACEADATEIHEPAIAECPGSLIGPYKLLQQIGEGGMGVVFMAEQERPVRRKVALKIIKPGMDTRQVIARFEAERQVLALMDHPNIAKVLDAGMVGAASRAAHDGMPQDGAESPPRLAGPTGRPYFVMELVQGVPITEYCDQCNLTTRERLELFIIVCQAVQHAHQKGVIHRDIKPTNVLVALQDGRPEPKIIDFGVAKAIDQRLTEHTQMTAFAQMVGTPLYMSPEQAELSPLGVDTRSDIYSLGVLLYELLTGTTPFDKDRMHAASYDELRRIIREEEPPRPSARITTLAADKASTVAEHRRTDSRRLSQQVRGELDWIVMKCLEKDRNRRYETPSSLARDIERYLQDEPVQACPPSTTYRLKKFVRRNKVATAFVALLLIGVAGLGFSNIVIKRERDAKTTALARATTESARAKAVSNLLQEMLGSADTDRAKGADYTVRELLGDFSERLDSQLADQPAAEADVHATMARAFRSLLLPDLAEPHFEKAINLRRKVDGPQHENLAAILVDYAWNLHRQGRFAEAETQLRTALDIYDRREITGGPVFYALLILQHVMISSGRYDDAERIHEQALAVASQNPAEAFDKASLLHRFAGMRNHQGRFTDAEKLAREAIGLHRQRRGDKHPETAWAISVLATALKGQQKLADAESAFRESLAIFRRCYGENHEVTGLVRDELKSVLTARGDAAAIEALAGDDAAQPNWFGSPDQYLRDAELLLATIPSESARKEIARRLIRQAIDEYGKVAVDSPHNMERVLETADGYMEITKLCLTDPDFAQEIDAAYRRLSEGLERWLAELPGSAGFQIGVAHRYRNWALLVEGNVDCLPQFEDAQRQAIQLFEKLVRDDPEMHRTWFYLADGYARLGEALLRLEKADDSKAAFERAIEICEQHAADFENIFGSRFIVNLYVFVGHYLSATHRERQAAEYVRAAAVHAARLSDPTAATNLLGQVAIVQARLGDKESYRETCKAIVEMPFDQLASPDKWRLSWTLCFAPDALDDPSLPVKLGEKFLASSTTKDRQFALCQLGAAHYRAGQFEQAAERLEESIAANPRDSSRDNSINYCRLFLAMTQWQMGRQGEARRLLAETLPAVEKELQPPASHWSRRATLGLVRREAETLITQTATNEAVENENRARSEE